MLLSDFDYGLPEELIAQHPCEPRDQSRLLALNRLTGDIAHQRFYHVLDYLREGDVLVFNDTRVIPARLMGTRNNTGGKIEVFLLNSLGDDQWEVLVKPGKKALPGTVIHFGGELQAEVLSSTDFGGRRIRFQYQGIFNEILDRLGETPLPPYIREILTDKERYQTVYAREQGSAAAPTAGLHFTKELMEKIREKGVFLTFITLHVGLGTFRPVREGQIEDHVMHREYYSISPETAQIVNSAKKEGRRVIAVGTTSVRALETAGASGRIAAKTDWTDIFIYPGYQYRIVDGLITNFHLPKSTLLMLVSAFAGQEAVFRAYREAVKEQYRFFSFGDAMIII